MLLVRQMKFYVRYVCIGITALLVGLCIYEYWPSRVSHRGLTASERKYDALRARFGDGHILQGDIDKHGKQAFGNVVARGKEEDEGVNPFGIQPIPKEIPGGRVDRKSDDDDDKPLRVFARSRHDFGSFGYNVERSDHIPHFRALPNTRNKNCPNRTFVVVEDDDETGKRGLRLSVIIYLYNEALSVLMRSIYSVLNRTPTFLLEEIIVVDDTSDFEELQKALEEEVKHLTQVRLVRKDLHVGQPIAKNEAARLARGNILAFLCSRCEVNDNWIEPLIVALGFSIDTKEQQRVKRQTRRIVAPIIDNIEMNSFGYEKAPVLFPGFTWNLLFTWQSVPQRILALQHVEYSNDLIEPFQSATFHGAAIALSAETFRYLGGFDESLESWGIIGEDSMDLTLRTWLCGGQVLTVPCSRVGYVYAERHPFNQLPPGFAMMDTYTFNTLRAAHTWFDEGSLQEFFKWNPSATKSKRFGNISQAIKFKHDHKCQSFDWFVKSIYPELEDKRHKSSRVDANKPAGGQPNAAENRVATKIHSGKLQLRTSTDGADGKFCLSLVDQSTMMKKENRLGSPGEQNERWFAKVDVCQDKAKDAKDGDNRNTVQYDSIWNEFTSVGSRNVSEAIELRTRWVGTAQALCLTVADTVEQSPFVGMGSLHRVVARACQDDRPRQVWRWRAVENSDKRLLESVGYPRKCLAVAKVAADESVYIDNCSKDDILQIKFLSPS